MASLLSKPTMYRRPMASLAVKELVESLSGATNPPTERDLHYPMNKASAEKVAAAINEVNEALSGIISGDGPFDLEPGQTLLVSVDGAAAETVTFDAAPAVLAGSGGTFAAMAAETMDIAVDGGDPQTITFGTQATLELARDLINAQLVGATASINVDQIDITSDSRGTGASLETSNVAAGITTKLGIQNNATEEGTGDVADIDAVTAAEAATLINADTTGATAAAVGDAVSIKSDETDEPSSIAVTGGTALDAFGFLDAEDSLTAVTSDDLKDPWSEATMDKLKRVVV